MTKILRIFTVIIILLAAGYLIPSSKSRLSSNSGRDVSGASVSAGELSQEESAAAEGVDELTVSAASANLKFHPQQTSEIRAVFHGRGNFQTGKVPRLELQKEGNKVRIKLEYPENFGISFTGFSFESSIDIYLPDRSYSKISVDTVSGNLSCPRLAARNLSLTTVSGGMNLGVIVAETAEFGTTSGDMLFTRISAVKTACSSVSGRIRFDELLSDESRLNTTSGRLEAAQFKGKLELKTVSGDVELTSIGGSIEVSCEAVSGNLKLAFSDLSGFKVELSSMSGDISCELPMTVEKQDKKELAGRVGDGSGFVKMKTVSGGISLRKSGAI